MPKVFNWQIGREMDYPYEGARPDNQFAYIFDLNKCIACQTCTIACKTTWTAGKGQETMLWNNVESKPYGYFPLGWDIKILDMLGAQSWDGYKYTGKTLFEAAEAGEAVLGYLPDDMDYANPNIGEDDCYGDTLKGAVNGVADGSGGAYYDHEHHSWMFYLPRICNHCTFPACLASCSRKSIYKRKMDGIVLIDQDRCRGYRDCVKGCPYKRPFYNPHTRTSEKCIACYPYVEQGIQPQCVTMCIGKIRLAGYLSVPENRIENHPMDYLIHEKKIALPLYPQFGLEPNVYYIPPVHVPSKFLTQMFGPRVHEAVETYRNAYKDPKLLGALMLFGSTERILKGFRVEKNEVVGIDMMNGGEAVRVPITEPAMVRPFHDDLVGAYRHNIS